MKFEDVKSIGGKTKFIFNAPKWWVGALIMASLSALFGNIVWGKEGILRGLLIFGVSSYIGTVLSMAYARCIKELYWAKTDILLSITSISFSMIIYALLKFIAIYVQINMSYGLILAITMPIWLRHVYISSIIIYGQKRSLPISIMYPSLIFLFMSIYVKNWDVIYLFTLSSAASIFFSGLFLRSMDDPMRSVLGIGGLKFTMRVVEHYKEKSRKGREKLEAIFDGFGEAARVQFNTVSFARGGKLVGTLLVHTAHPGPFGEVGGADMPSKLVRITGLENLITPHGASTHDMNPTSEREVERLGKAVKKSLPGKEVLASEPVRTSSGKVKVLAQRFGDTLMAIETSSPYGTEDIDPSVAYALNEKVKNFGFESLIFIDAHNRFENKAEETKIQSRKYLEIEKAIIEAANILKKSRLYPVKVGFGDDRSLDIEHGLAKLGVTCLILEVNEKKAGYIVLDGNNMGGGLRERIISEVGKGLDFVEVMTTDNHYVNRISGGKNPVGEFGGHEKIINACKNAVERAKENISPANLMVSGGETEIRVFGPNRSAYLFCVPRSLLSCGKYASILSVTSLILADLALAMLI